MGLVGLGDFAEMHYNTIPYLEGQTDLVSELIMGIIGVTIWIIGGVINLLAKSP